jgi:hypothetical protein
LIYGRHPIVPAEAKYNPESYRSSRGEDFIEKLEAARTRAKYNTLAVQESAREFLDSKRVNKTLEEHSLVMCSYPNLGTVGIPHKFDALTTGPHRILRAISSIKYEIENTNKPFQKHIVHVGRLIPLKERPVYLEESGESELELETGVKETTDSKPLRRSVRFRVAPDRLQLE